jgi:hypothetical protein
MGERNRRAPGHTLDEGSPAYQFDTLPQSPFASGRLSNRVFDFLDTTLLAPKPPTLPDLDLAALDFQNKHAVLTVKDQEVGLSLASGRGEIVAGRICPRERMHDNEAGPEAGSHCSRDVGL